MNEVFKKRRERFYSQNLKYLRYVFNDHFTLFLLILLGALAVQYAQFLQNHTLTSGEKIGVVILLSALALVPGRFATFVEPADKVFLLVKEIEFKKYLIQAMLRSLILPSFVVVLLVFISSPLLGLPLGLLILWPILLLLIKAGLFFYLFQSWQKNGILNWTMMINAEENRKVSILRFFALFTNVKGLKSHSHRRKYLDFLLPKTRRTYEYILSRSFLRSGEYLGLTLRLLLLSVLALIFIKNSILAVVLVCVLNALLVYQLIALREAVDYQLFTRIYPLRNASKSGAVQRILIRVIGFLTLIEIILGLIFIHDRLWLLAIVGINFLLAKFYIKNRLKK